MLDKQKLAVFPLRSETEQGCVLPSHCSTSFWKFQPETTGKKNISKSVIAKQEVKLFLFSDDMIPQAGKPKVSTNKPLEFMRELGKVVGLKSIELLHTVISRLRTRKKQS